MVEQDGARGKGRGGLGRGRGGHPGGGRLNELTEWVPVTNLGRLVKLGKITHINQIYTHSLQIKEYQIIDKLFEKDRLMEESMKIMPVQKQTQAGQRTRFKAYVVVGDGKGHIGLGSKCAKEVQMAVRGATIAAKLSLIPVRMGYWGGVFGNPHTVPMKTSGKYASVEVRLIPAPRGSGLVAGPKTKRMLELSGIQDCYTCSRGRTSTTGNTIKATFEAMAKTYSYLTPDQWVITELPPSPVEQFWKDLSGKTNFESQQNDLDSREKEAETKENIQNSND